MAEKQQLKATIRDFLALNSTAQRLGKKKHLDFQYVAGSKVEKNIVRPVLGADGKPEFADGPKKTVNNRESFSTWYNDDPDYNQAKTDYIIPLEEDPTRPGFFVFDDQTFFPIDNELFGNEGLWTHNFHFTLELKPHVFTYQGDEIFTFAGDDDLWVFINDKLVIDLGGTHVRATGTIDLRLSDHERIFDQILPTGERLVLEKGKSYPFVLFFAERHTENSHFRVETTFRLAPPPTVKLLTPDDEAAEQPLDPGKFRFVLEEGKPLDDDLTVSFAVSGKAQEGDDYQSIGRNIVIPKGQTRVDLPIIPLFDQELEGDEPVTVTLLDRPSYQRAMPYMGTVTIKDYVPAPPTVSIVATKPNAAEAGNGQVQADGEFRIKLSQPAPEALTIAYEVSGTALPGVDYDALPLSVTIDKGATFVDLPVVPIADEQTEGDETVIVTLKSGADYNLNPIPAKTTATVTIIDAPPTPIASIQADPPKAIEPFKGSPKQDGGFVISLDRPAWTDLTINYRDRGGTAQSGQDYIALAPSVTILEGQTSVQLPVVPLEDRIPDPDETVIVTLEPGEGYDLYPEPGHIKAAVIIEDVYVPVAGVVATQPMAVEPGQGNSGVNGAFQISLTHAAPADITVEYHVLGTATPNTDYVALPKSVTLPKGRKEIDLPVVPKADAAKEPTETVVVVLKRGEGYDVDGAIAPTRATVKIVDTYVLPQVTLLTPDPDAAEEPLDPGQFVVALDEPHERDVTVKVEVGGTAIADIDYQSTPFNINPQTITIPAGQTQVAVPVIPIFDEEQEGNETVTVTVLESEHYKRIEPITGTVTIADYLIPSIHIVASKPEAAEAGYGQAQVNGEFTISLNKPALRDLTLGYTVRGSALPNLDYIALAPSPLTIKQGETTVRLPVVPKTDALQEGNETVIVTLNPGSGYTLNPAQSEATVTIIDAPPPPIVSIKATQPGAREPFMGQPRVDGEFTVVLDRPAWSDLTIRYQDIGGTATSGQDYQRLSQQVVIRQNTLSAKIPVIPLEDRIKEGNESVMVRLQAGTGYELDPDITDQQAVVIIGDRFIPPIASVTAPQPNAKEPGRGTPAINGLFQLSLDKPAFADTTLRYQVVGSAIPNTDYTALPATVLIRQGQTAVTLPVVPKGDGIREGTETVVIVLQGGTGYQVNPAQAPTRATVNIMDVPPPPLASIVASKPNAKEPGHGQARIDGEFTIQLSGVNPLGRATRIHYHIGGTATTGVDYQALATAVIPAGKTSVKLPVIPLGDQVKEGSETVTLTLTKSVEYDLHPSFHQATVTIADVPPIVLVATIKTTKSPAHEPQGRGKEAPSGKQGRFLIELSHPAPQKVVVKYGISGSAKQGRGKDYLLRDKKGKLVTNNTAVFKKGQRQAMINVVPLGDRQFDEGNETVVATLKNNKGYTLKRNKKKATVVIKPYRSGPGAVGGDQS